LGVEAAQRPVRAGRVLARDKVLREDAVVPVCILTEERDGATVGGPARPAQDAAPWAEDREVKGCNDGAISDANHTKRHLSSGWYGNLVREIVTIWRYLGKSHRRTYHSGGLGAIQTHLPEAWSRGIARSVDDPPVGCRSWVPG